MYCVCFCLDFLMVFAVLSTMNHLQEGCTQLAAQPCVGVTSCNPLSTDLWLKTCTKKLPRTGALVP